jgi:hypothetical protein
MPETELFDFMLGQRLDYGAFREVFVLKHDPSLVIKVATEKQGQIENMVDYKMWQLLDMTPSAKWFAPIIDISDNGKYLIQKRIEPLPKSQYPEKIPSFFTDTKYVNFGWLEGVGFVCCDLGSINITKGLPTQLIKASWWKEE